LQQVRNVRSIQFPNAKKRKEKQKHLKSNAEKNEKKPTQETFFWMRKRLIYKQQNLHRQTRPRHSKSSIQKSSTQTCKSFHTNKIYKPSNVYRE
jgi:hypothetical protein